MTGDVLRHPVDDSAAFAVAEALLADEEKGAGLLWCIASLNQYEEIIDEIARLSDDHARPRPGADPHKGKLETPLTVRHAMLNAVAIFKPALPFDGDADSFGVDDVLQRYWGRFQHEPYDDKVEYLLEGHRL